MSFSESEALESPAVSAISLDQDVTRVSVTGIQKNPLAMSRLFASVAQNGVNVDIIVHNSPLHSPTFNVGFTVTKADLASAMLALELLKKEPDFSQIQIGTSSDLAKVSAVGLGMKSHSGVAAKVFETLSREKIEVLMVSTSEIKISCVVSLAEGKRAVQALHQSFF